MSDDPVARWGAALDALNDHGDVRELAELLRGSSEIPSEVRGVIAEMLDPKLGKHLFNVRLVPKRTNGFDKMMRRGLRNIQIVNEVGRQLETNASLEIAIMAAAEQLSVSDSWVWKCWRATPAFYKAIIRRHQLRH
jgi:hypothetical protein